jgi:hypothetical protein
MRAPIIVCTLVVFLALTLGYASPPTYEDEDVLALEISGALLAPSTLVAQIAQDLTAIRVAFPEVADIHVSPSWEPGVILVQLTDEAWADYQEGLFHDFDSLNVEYGPVTIDPLFAPNTLQLEFENLYHPEVLAPIYEQVEGVLLADPDFFFGDGDDIFSQQTGIYTFKKGWGDCLAGCPFEHFWELSVKGDVVELIDEYGDVVTGVDDRPLGLATSLEQNIPNPFNPDTMIRYRVSKRSWVRLMVYDATGRLIRELQNGFVSPGTHTATWDATKSGGVPVASGVYFYELVVDGSAHSKKMVLAK